MSTKYNHAEAFTLMRYSCKCGYNELIWNSRDGVTPFSCECPSCKSDCMSHTHWRQDFCSPNHELKSGERFWRDGTPDEAEAFMNVRIESMKDQFPLGNEERSRLIQDARSGEGDFPNGWPFLDTHPVNRGEK